MTAHAQGTRDAKYRVIRHERVVVYDVRATDPREPARRSRRTEIRPCDSCGTPRFTRAKPQNG